MQIFNIRFIFNRHSNKDYLPDLSTYEKYFYLRKKCDFEKSLMKYSRKCVIIKIGLDLKYTAKYKKENGSVRKNW